jgi:hypothetical protein
LDLHPSLLASPVTHDRIASEITAEFSQRTPRAEDGPQIMKDDIVNAPVMNIPSAVGPVGDRATGNRNERSGSRFETPELLTSFGHEENLIVDDRAALRPAEVVESKLTRLLQEASLPVSHLQMRGLLRTR